MLLQNGKVYSLKPLVPELMGLSVPARVGVQVARLVKKLTAEIALLDQERDKLIIKYGEINEVGAPVIYGYGNPDHPVSPGLEDYAREYSDLMSGEVDIEFNKLQLPGEAVVSVPLLLAFEDFLEVIE